MVSWFAVSVITWNCTSPRLNRSAASIDTFPENLGLLVPGYQIFVVEVEQKAGEGNLHSTISFAKRIVL